MNTIIEKIRAEIKGVTETARNTRINGTTQQAKEADAIIHALDNLMLKISDLEKSEKPINPTIEKLRALIKMQIRREELNFASLGGGGQTMNIGALEWVLKQLDTLQEQPVNGPFTGEQIYKFLKEQQGFPNWHSNPLEGQPVDLEKEIASFITQFGWGNTKHLAEKELINCTARHFYELGRNTK